MSAEKIMLGCVHTKRNNYFNCRNDAEVLTLGVHTRSDERSSPRNRAAEKPAHIFRRIVIIQYIRVNSCL